jgi:hypothetical protein
VKILLLVLAALGVGGVIAFVALSWAAAACLPWHGDEDSEGVGAADAETMQRIEDATVAEWKRQRADRQAVQDRLAESRNG